MASINHCDFCDKRAAEREVEHLRAEIIFKETRLAAAIYFASPGDDDVDYCPSCKKKAESILAEALKKVAGLRKGGK